MYVCSFFLLYARPYRLTYRDQIWHSGGERANAVKIIRYYLHTHRFVSVDIKPVDSIHLGEGREELELSHVPTPTKCQSAVGDCRCLSLTSSAAVGTSDTCNPIVPCTHIDLRPISGAVWWFLPFL
ncbi:hypothetical protein AVEN_199614-1 [Araneus ventricosus]|uniref:Uncharacterized protein n=1 Tax=Araneus ventricosus TaxID=182803 RepID=A0A4Y1ZKB0_ARAVE|nr:hypothetical protein AVEN_199614-1 [Araneus ventricosus]